MSNHPIIAGTFVDLRQIKSRAVWQILIEVPAEEAEKLVETFGLPRQDEPTWLAVARLKAPPGAQKATSAIAAADASSPSAAAPGGGKREYTLANRIGMTCADPAFKDWVAEQCGWGSGTADVAATWVRQKCGVKSRADILPGSAAAEKWNAIALDFERSARRVAEERR